MNAKRFLRNPAKVEPVRERRAGGSTARRVLLAGLIPLLVLLLAGAPAQAASEADVANQIDAMALSSSAKGTVRSGFLQGIRDGRLSADAAFDFLQSVSTSGAPLVDRETVLVAIAGTLLGDTPVEMLINKVVEGLARGFPMDVIAAEVVERGQTLGEVKALLASKGIRIQSSADDGGFPRTEVDAAVTDIATVLEDHVRSGSDPDDGTLLGRTRNTLQRDGRIGNDLFQTLSNALGEAELARIARNIENRIN